MGDSYLTSPTCSQLLNCNGSCSMKLHRNSATRPTSSSATVSILSPFTRLVVLIIGAAVIGISHGFSVPSFVPNIMVAAPHVGDGHTRAPQRLLVFGGNGFLGGATVERLLADGHEVVTINRGNWYWDSAYIVKPYVTQVTCDRLYPLHRCQQMLDMLSNDTRGFDVVIDFSAYHLDAVTEALKVLQDKVKLYIYISTDSVYDVCDKKHTHPSTETDSVRPESLDRQKELEGVESYGHRKLQIEEELFRQRADGGVPYIALRLPDVIGPKDNTYRWWIYQVWMKLSDYLDKQLSIPSYLVSTPMSLVYVNDVADLVIKLLDFKPEVLDQAFNVAFKETPTLLQILTGLRSAMNLTDLPILTDESSNSIHLFPSVRSGPLDISRAEQLLDFKPTPLHQAIAETVEFYEKAMTNPVFHSPRKEIIRNMQAHFTSRPYKVMLGLKKHYGLEFQEPKEEL